MQIGMSVFMSDYLKIKIKCNFFFTLSGFFFDFVHCHYSTRKKLMQNYLIIIYKHLLSQLLYHTHAAKNTITHADKIFSLKHNIVDAFNSLLYTH